jgi:hypothetical protein
MRSGIAVGLFVLELVALLVFTARLSRYRVDHSEKPSFLRVWTENARGLAPSSYTQVGRRLLPWLWIGYLIALATAFYLVRALLSES